MSSQTFGERAWRALRGALAEHIGTSGGWWKNHVETQMEATLRDFVRERLWAQIHHVDDNCGIPSDWNDAIYTCARALGVYLGDPK